MSGKKMAAIIVGIVIVASLLSVISIQLFFKYYDPKVNVDTSDESALLTPTLEQTIITLNSR